MPRLLSSLVLFCLTAAVISAQSVRWQPAGGVLERGQAMDLVLIFENCLPTADIVLPEVTNLSLGTPQQSKQDSSSISSTGRITTRRMLYLAYAARPQGDDEIVIPAFTVSTDQGDFVVPTARFEVREATVGDTDIPVAQVAQARISLGAETHWAGQVIPIDYQLEVSARFRAQLGGNPEWEPTPLVVEEWNEPTRESSGVGGDARNILTYSTRGYINTPGNYVIPSVQQLVNIGIPTAGFLQSLRAEQYAITSDSPRLVVQPLPSPAPASFDGAVGDFQLSSRVVPETAEVGEPVTWTLELTGTGNWPDIPGLPARQASQTFRVVQPDAKREIPEGRLFDGSIAEDVVLIPTRAGDFQLGPVEWTYFDPTAGRYKTISAPATTLQITASTAPVAAPQVGQASDPLPPPMVGGNPPATVTASPAPTSPSSIPLEILPGSASSPKPLSTRNTITIAAALFALFPLIWIWLSSQHARRHDSGRPARLARRRLQQTLIQIGRHQGTAQHPHLLAWQQDSAALWQRSAATPLKSLFEGDQQWIDLWREAERALYAESSELPDDWASRARSALAAKRAPRFPIHRVLSPRHLFPVWLLALWISLPSELPAQASEAYQSGDFAAAETAWRSAIAADGSDWVAHHNLALALAQQSRWNEAGAHAAVAFVQQPRHPSTRWHLAYTLERSGYTPPVIGEFLNPRWSHRIAQVASPAEWRNLLLIGVALGVLGLVLLLLHAYGRRIVGWRLLSWLLGLTSVSLMASALFSIQIWSTTADHRAALTWEAGELRSIPTDLDSEQQTTALAAGSLCRVEKAFLGWRQISFPNGQTGWVRREALVPLWR